MSWLYCHYLPCGQFNSAIIPCTVYFLALSKNVVKPWLTTDTANQKYLVLLKTVYCLLKNVSVKAYDFCKVWQKVCEDFYWNYKPCMLATKIINSAWILGESRNCPRMSLIGQPLSRLHSSNLTKMSLLDSREREI